jgi:D-alanine-D-alanine ligase
VTDPAHDAGRVVVLAGGLSHEREVSLRSGRRVAERCAPPASMSPSATWTPTLLAYLASDAPLCVVPLLHGRTARTARCKKSCRWPDVAYAVRTPSACRLAFDKSVAKSV